MAQPLWRENEANIDRFVSKGNLIKCCSGRASSLSDASNVFHSAYGLISLGEAASVSLSANDYAMIGWNHLGMHWADAFDVAAGMGTGGSGGMGGGCLGGGSIVIDQPVGVLFRDPPVFANLRQGPK